MRLYVIDEMILRNKHNLNEVNQGLHIRCVEIPDEALLQLKTAYELWLQEKRDREVKNETQNC